MTKLEGLHVYLNVSNVEKSAAFYEGLGFTRAFTFPPPMNVIGYKVGKDTLLIGPADDPNADAATKAWIAQKPWGVGTVLMPQVKDVDVVYKKALAIGAEIEQKPTLQSYGSKTLQLSDPDGYSFIFDQPVTATPPGSVKGKGAKSTKSAKASKSANASKGAKKPKTAKRAKKGRK